MRARCGPTDANWPATERFGFVFSWSGGGKAANPMRGGAIWAAPWNGRGPEIRRRESAKNVASLDSCREFALFEVKIFASVWWAVLSLVGLVSLLVSRNLRKRGNSIVIRRQNSRIEQQSP
jgi:hypothetical protein